VYIKIPREVWRDILSLLEAFDTEWLAYAKWVKEEDSGVLTYHVTELVIPRQEVTGASVDVDEEESTLGVGLGVIHCHPWCCKPDFSGIDEAYINANHPFSIVVSKDAKFTAVAVVETPCKARIATVADVIVERDRLEERRIVQIAKEKIRKKTFSVIGSGWVEPVRGLGYYAFPIGEEEEEEEKQPKKGKRKHSKQEELDCFEELDLDWETGGLEEDWRDYVW